MIEIKPSGRFLPLDENGFFVNNLSEENLKSPWREALTDIVTLYKTVLGEQLHSVYVRGSVAVGDAVETISDIDTLAVYTTEISDEQKQELREKRKKLSAKMPFANGVEMTGVSLEKLLTDKSNVWQFIIKTLAICLYGNDLSAQLNAFRPDENVRFDLPHFERHIAEIREELQQETERQKIIEICVWTMKRILRSGMELSLLKTKKFSRDLYPCYTVFAETYPPQAENMRQVLQLALNPVADKQTIFDLLDLIAPFVADEYKRQGEVLGCFRTREE